MAQRGTTSDENPSTGVAHQGRRYNGWRIWQWEGPYFSTVGGYGSGRGHVVRRAPSYRMRTYVSGMVEAFSEGRRYGVRRLSASIWDRAHPAAHLPGG